MPNVRTLVVSPGFRTPPAPACLLEPAWSTDLCSGRSLGRGWRAGLDYQRQLELKRGWRLAHGVAGGLKAQYAFNLMESGPG